MKISYLFILFIACTLIAVGFSSCTKHVPRDKPVKEKKQPTEQPTTSPRKTEKKEPVVEKRNVVQVNEKSLKQINSKDYNQLDISIKQVHVRNPGSADIDWPTLNQHLKKIIDYDSTGENGVDLNLFVSVFPDSLESNEENCQVNEKRYSSGGIMTRLDLSYNFYNNTFDYKMFMDKTYRTLKSIVKENKKEELQ